MENKEIIIPDKLQKSWEQEAISQRLPLSEFSEFIRMKERRYVSELSQNRQTEKVFANDARNKFTSFGNSLAYQKIMELPRVERAVKVSRFSFEELRNRFSRGFANEEQRKCFLSEREEWFLRLKERMKDLKISKEVLESFGLSWTECKSFAYQSI